jgi:hypothetical protein
VSFLFVMPHAVDDRAPDDGSDGAAARVRDIPRIGPADPAGVAGLLGLAF